MAASTTLPTPGTGHAGPFRFCVAILVVVVITILKGALTTSTGSGLAYLDWPLSDGQLMPESSYTTLPGFFEHFHRLVAASAGLMALWLAIWLQFWRRGTPAARFTAWFGGTLILIQAIIGGVGVLKGLPALTSVTHGTLAQLTLATFGCLAYLLSDRYGRTPVASEVPTGSGRKLAVMGVAILVIQTVVGAVARHTNNSHALWTHVGNAFVVFVVVAISTAFAVGKIGSTPGIKGLARTIVTLMLLQIVLGFIALLVRNAAGKTPENVANLGTATLISFHVLLGAILTVLAATLAAHVFRATRAPAAA